MARVSIGNEPTPDAINEIVEDSRAENFDVVIAIGGGSVLDAGKAVSAMLKENEHIENYLEGVGTTQPSGRKVPFIAVPTTAGTGSEATANAVLCSIGRDGYKKSLRHDNYLPNLALVDPELTTHCPPQLSLACSMDCFSQLVEGYLSTGSSQLTDILAVDGLKAVSRSLRQVSSETVSPAARSDMSYATLLSGIVLTNAGLGTVHGFASAIGGLIDIPHGLVCGTLMYATNKITLEKLREDPESAQHKTGLQKYAELGRIFSQETHNNDAWYQDFFIETLGLLTDKMNKAKLSDYGADQTIIPAIIDRTGNKKNPAILDKEDLIKILELRL